MSDPTNTDEFEMKDDLLQQLYEHAYMAGVCGEREDSKNEDMNMAKAQAIITKLRERDERVAREARIKEAEYIDDKLYDVSARSGEWGIPTKWSKEQFGEENYADLWTPNRAIHNFIAERLATLKPNSKESE